MDYKDYAILGVCGALIVSSAIVYNIPNTDKPNAVVKVTLDKGHGSAVHIGDGIYVTAAHVVQGNRSVALDYDDGNRRVAEVLWSTDVYDVALVKTEYAGGEARDLDCRIAEPGESIELRGNPMNLENISTWGKIGGELTSVGENWKEVLPVDGTIAGGMSGGGVFDQDGDVIGINVGAQLMPMGFSATLTGITFIVPSQTICNLMGRI